MKSALSQYVFIFCVNNPSLMEGASIYCENVSDYERLTDYLEKKEGKMMQVYNPYLPPQVCIPDGEPHVFGDRVYIFGSHDKEGGDAFCMLDYECFSAPVENLSRWRSEGVIYRAKQDPDYDERNQYMYAPDVVRGNDGRYYLYYAMSGGHFTGPIHVAVCDTPGGKYEYYGYVKNPDGSVFHRHITFDPGVINDDGIIRLYYGWALAVDYPMVSPMPPEMKEQLLQVEMQMFEKTKEEIESEPDGIEGANVVRLNDDMLTVTEGPTRIVPGQFQAGGTGFEGHAFFEASSIRKIGSTYYFIYSSEAQHELCYATSKYPDREFSFGGVIISNGDIGYQGRSPQARVAATGNNHGSIENINGQWYIFYHRQTHKTSFSRQGCAEKINILPDGSISQVEMTSCGLNDGPLAAAGVYPAYIACCLNNGPMPHISPQGVHETIPYITHSGDERFIAAIDEHTEIGFKYFKADGPVKLKIKVRGTLNGRFEVWSCDVGGGNQTHAGTITVEPSKDWGTFETQQTVMQDTFGLFLKYTGDGTGDLLSIEFEEV